MAGNLTQNFQFDAVCNFDEIEAEEREMQKRRIATYRPDALKIASQISKKYVRHTCFIEGLDAMNRVFQIAREFVDRAAELAQHVVVRPGAWGHED